MSNYVELVNKVLLESGKEQDLLDEDTWDSLDAGRRIYPRVKRLVREAWKTIQMSRNEWEFNTAELRTTVLPRLKFKFGSAPGVLPTLWRGAISGTVIQELEYFNEGDWVAGTAAGQIEFVVVSGNQLITGEEFFGEDEDGSFLYTEKGSYDFLSETQGLIREPHWSTFVAGNDSSYPNPVCYVPWDNYAYKTYNYHTGSNNTPSYVSQDFEGKMVFYPQSITPFTLSFVYDVAPQELVTPWDEPFNLPLEYHDWIAWAALMNLARFDKDPDLFSYASAMHDQYQKRAERSLLPIPSYRASPFNRGWR